METITAEYTELNRQMHDDGHFGVGSYRWADQVVELRNIMSADTVLDYGCGKGVLGQSLGSPSWYHGYDPAVEEYAGTPDAADIVVCSDVLEHIEPDLLDNTIKTIADLALKAVFLVIPTTPARKFLPDGRNAHLTVESAEWWRKKLDETFIISSWSVLGGEIVAVGTTVRKLAGIIPKSAVSDTLRFENSLRNCAIVPARVVEAPRHDGRVVIACYGPSLKETWQTIAIEKRVFGATIVSVSGAHDFLIERGIVPDIHVECDPRDHKAWFTRNPHKDVKYWMASCCAPKTIDQLIGQDLTLWHVYNSENDHQIIAPDGPDPDGFLVCGAGTVGARAINLMFIRGYRSFSIYGMDCCFTEDGEQHAGAHSGKLQNVWDVRVGERWFKTSGPMVYNAKGIVDNMKVLAMACEANSEPKFENGQYIEMFLHGDTLLTEMYGGASSVSS